MFLFPFAAHTFAAQQPPPSAQTKYVVDRIDTIGNRRIRTETLKAHMTLHTGDPYSVDAVQRDVQSLLTTGFFEDVPSEVEDSPHVPNGKIVIFVVQEKAIIASIDYQGIKSITESDIRTALKNQKVKLPVGDWFDQADLKRAVNVITQLLASHGYQSATVKPTYEGIASFGTVAIVFNIDEGPKTKSSPTTRKNTPAVSPVFGSAGFSLCPRVPHVPALHVGDLG